MRLRQLLDLLPRSTLWMKQGHSFDQSFVHAVARVLRRQNPFDACFGRSVDELRLLAHGHEAEGENGSIDALESGCEEVGVGVGAFLDFERGIVAGECGGRVGAGDDCDGLEVVGG